MTLREYADAIRKGDDPLAVLRIAVSEAESSALERAARLVAGAPWHYQNVAKRIRALIPPAAAPAAETGKDTCARCGGDIDHGRGCTATETGQAEAPDPERDRNRHNAMLVEAWREEFGRLCDALYPGHNGMIGWKHIHAKIAELLAARAAPPEREGT